MNRIKVLDGVRGIAILLVLAGHIAANYQPLAPAVRHWVEAYANASFGVRLFFVLSGYLITTLLLKERATTGTISLPKFYARRAWRILPAAWLFLLLIALLPALRPPSLTPGNWLAAATYTWNYSLFWLAPADRACWELGHFWTLAVEQQFYLLWPLALIALGRERTRWLAAAVTLWCPIARVGTYFLFPAQRGTTGMMFHTAADSIMIGCLAAMIVGTPFVEKILDRHGRRVALFATIWVFIVSPTLVATVRGYTDVAGTTLDALAAAWLVLWLPRPTATRASIWIATGPLPWLGRLSFSLYLWQQIELNPAGSLARGSIVVPCMAAIVLASASYFFVERPLLRWSGRRFSGSVEAPAASTA